MEKYGRIYGILLGVAFLLGCLCACEEPKPYSSTQWLAAKQACESKGLSMIQYTNGENDIVNVKCVSPKGGRLIP